MNRQNFYFKAVLLSQFIYISFSLYFPIESQIQNVTVLGSNAIVTRQFSFSLSELVTPTTYLTLSLESLPSTIVESTIRISGFGPAQV